MKKILIILALAMTIVSCQPNDNKEIRKAFKEYVRTDFDNPKDFIEITKIEIEDTICKEKMIKMAAGIEKGATLLNYKSVAEDARDYINKFNNDDTFIVLYKLKVRIKGNEESYIKEYYAIDNKGVIVIQCYALMVNQLPEIYSNFLDDCNVMTMKLNLFMKVSNSFLEGYELNN